MEDITLDLVFSGSVFKDKGTLAAEAIYKAVVKEAPKARLVHARYEPVCGAVLTLLDREYKNDITDDVNGSFDKSARAYSLLRNLSLDPV